MHKNTQNVQYIIANTKKGEISRSPQTPTNQKIYEELLLFFFLEYQRIEFLDSLNGVDTI